MDCERTVQDGDLVVFTPSSFPGITLIGPLTGNIKAQPVGVKVNGKVVCVVDDVKEFKLKCSYQTPTFSTSGMGTITIKKLNEDQIALHSRINDKCELIVGTKFIAQFKVDSPASIPVVGKTDDTPMYMGNGGFKNLTQGCIYTKSPAPEPKVVQNANEEKQISSSQNNSESSTASSTDDAMQSSPSQRNVPVDKYSPYYKSSENNKNKEKIEYDQRFYVRSPEGFPVAGQQYYFEYGGKKTEVLKTGNSGETKIIKSDSAEKIKIWFIKTPDVKIIQGALDNPIQDINEDKIEQKKLWFNKENKPFAEAYFTPKDQKTRIVVSLPPHKVIPIILVPGIMGSNLRSTKANKDPAWQPPNGGLEKANTVIMGNGGTYSDPSEKQTSLNPNATEVFSPPNETIKFPDHTKYEMLSKDEVTRRGWGEVNQESYNEILYFLEDRMNNKNRNAFGVKTEVEKEWATLTNDHNVILKNWDLDKILTYHNESDVGKACSYYFAVHAVGYNWLQSNADSAKRLEEKVGDFFKHYEDKHPYYEHIGKVILVTHSMGGLVARSYAHKNKENEAKILGILHGVLPVNGAPVVYRRFRAGTEVESYGDGRIANFFAAHVLGYDASHVTAIMANAQGPLELLPNKSYNDGKPWLKVFSSEKPDEPHLALPRYGDPYKEIYGKRVQDCWWGMVDENLMNPANLKPEDSRKNSFQNYTKRLDKVEDFHDKLAGYFFKDNTYAYYGKFQTQPGYSEIRWYSEDGLPEGTTDRDIESAPRADSFFETDHSFQGSHSIQGKDRNDYEAEMVYQSKMKNGRAIILLKNKNTGKNDAAMQFDLVGRAPDENGYDWGDGTVPVISGQALNECAAVIPFEASQGDVSSKKRKDFDHQLSYKNKDVQLVTLWSLVSILKLLKES